jgi:hypothetical protein
MAESCRVIVGGDSLSHESGFVTKVEKKIGKIKGVSIVMTGGNADYFFNINTFVDGHTFDIQTVSQYVNGEAGQSFYTKKLSEVLEEFEDYLIKNKIVCE